MAAAIRLSGAPTDPLAIEDIGLADPRAQSMALEATWDIYSDSAARRETRLRAAGAVPGQHCPVERRLCDSTRPRPTCVRAVPKRCRCTAQCTGKLMKELGYGAGIPVRPRCRRRHRADPTGFPDAMVSVYYNPVPRGLEIKLKEKLDRLRAEREARAAKGR